MNVKEKYVLEHYEISKEGTIYSPYTKKFLKFREDKDGYLEVTLIYNDEGKRQPFKLHRLLALKYIPEIEGYNVVNHKDLNKQNNNLDNLEWSTTQKNTQHGFDNCAYKSIRRVKVTETDGTINIFPNQSCASRYYGYKTTATFTHFLKDGGPHIPNKGKLKDYIIEYTDEGVTTIEKVANTDVSE